MREADFHSWYQKDKCGCCMLYSSVLRYSLALNALISHLGLMHIPVANLNDKCNLA